MQTKFFHYGQQGTREKMKYRTFPSKNFVKDPSIPGEFSEIECNCAGFVERCYEEAGFPILIDENSENFPAVTRDIFLDDLHGSDSFCLKGINRSKFMEGYFTRVSNKSIL